MVRRPERNHEAYNKSGLLNLGLTSLDIGKRNKSKADLTVENFV